MSASFDSYELLLTGLEHHALVEVPKQKREVKIHQEALDDYLKLRELAKGEGVDLQIVSGHRSYEVQKKIWNAKALGKRTVYNDQLEKLDPKDCDPQTYLRFMLRWSAFPGLSRHHWGTDFDIYDANIKDPTEVSLTPKECEEDFSKLYSLLPTWLEQTDFFRPYDLDRGGVAIEPWHLSYQPLSHQYRNDFTLELFNKILQDPELEMRELVTGQKDTIFSTYF